MATNNTKKTVKFGNYEFVIKNGRICPSKSNLKNIEYITDTTKRIAMGMTNTDTMGKTL